MAQLPNQQISRINGGEAVTNADGSRWRRGVLVSAGDAANTERTYAMNAAYAAQGGESPDRTRDPAAEGQAAYDQYAKTFGFAPAAPAPVAQVPAYTPTFPNAPVIGPVAPAAPAAQGYEMPPAFKAPVITPLPSNAFSSTSIFDNEFSRGGYTGPGEKYQPAGVVHADEFVIPKEKVQEIGVDKLDKMYGTDSSVMKAGYATGGAVKVSPKDVPGLFQAVQFLEGRPGFNRPALNRLASAGNSQMILDAADRERLHDEYRLSGSARGAAQVRLDSLNQEATQYYGSEITRLRAEADARAAAAQDKFDQLSAAREAAVAKRADELGGATISTAAAARKRLEDEQGLAGTNLNTRLITLAKSVGNAPRVDPNTQLALPQINSYEDLLTLPKTDPLYAAVEAKRKEVETIFSPRIKLAYTANAAADQAVRQVQLTAASAVDKSMGGALSIAKTATQRALADAANAEADAARSVAIKFGKEQKQVGDLAAQENARFAGVEKEMRERQIAAPTGAAPAAGDVNDTKWRAYQASLGISTAGDSLQQSIDREAQANAIYAGANRPLAAQLVEQAKRTGPITIRDGAGSATFGGRSGLPTGYSSFPLQNGGFAVFDNAGKRTDYASEAEAMGALAAPGAPPVAPPVNAGEAPPALSAGIPPTMGDVIPQSRGDAVNASLAAQVGPMPPQPVAPMAQPTAAATNGLNMVSLDNFGAAINAGQAQARSALSAKREQQLYRLGMAPQYGILTGEPDGPLVKLGSTPMTAGSASRYADYPQA